MSKAKEASAKPKRPKLTWQANKTTKEVHRVVEGEPHPGECHLDQIEEDNLIPFRTAKAAFACGFDQAAHCRRKFRSKENK